jgi:hypothetical protein
LSIFILQIDYHNMDPATEENQNGKRVKFAQNAGPSRTAPRTAISCAKLTASITIASLPEAITPLAEHYFSKFLASKIELLSLTTNKARLANADFVPTSARFKFQLKASTRVQEQAAAELKTLTDDSDYILEIFKNDIKNRVVKLVDLEIKILTDVMQFEMCVAIGALGIATALHHFGADTRKARTLVITTLEQNIGLLKHYHIHNEADVETDLQVFFGDLKAATNDPDDVHVVGTLSQEHLDSVAAAAPTYTGLLEALFVRSWDNYLARKAELHRQLAVKHFVEENLRENITADVAMELEDITVNSKNLGELVTAQVNAGTKKLQAKIARLELSIPKNQTGAQKSSAVKEKKKKDQKASLKKGANARQAAAADKDTAAVNDKPATGKNKKGKKKGNSNRKQRPRS